MASETYKSHKLTELREGEEGEVRYFSGGRGMRRKLNSMDIRPGKRFKVRSVQPFHGPVIVDFDRTTYTLGRGIASRIIVGYYGNDQES